MGKEGSVYVAWLNKGKSGEREFAVTFVPDGTIGSAIGYRKILGEESLREFLARSLYLGKRKNLIDCVFTCHLSGKPTHQDLRPCHSVTDDGGDRFKALRPSWISMISVSGR